MVISGRMKKALIFGSTLLGAAAMVGGDMAWMSGFSGDSEEGDEPQGKPRCRTLSDCDNRCGRGDGPSCYYAGQGRLQGVGGQPDPIGASVLFDRACKAGTPLGCTVLGSLHEQGVGVAADSAKALELFRQACAGGEEQGCAGVARLTGAPSP